MSEIDAIDPSNGFVMRPNDVFDRGLTPGAFYVLSILCKYADRGGHSWASLRQIGELIGKSKATVSAHVAELREAGLVTTERQTTANGYNYRLRFCVTFWAALRRKITPLSVRKTERSIQPVERLSKEEIQKPVKHTGSMFLRDLVRDWRDVVGKTPYPALNAPPSKVLLDRTKEAFRTESPAIITADIIRCVKQLWTDLSVSCSEQTLNEQVEALIGRKLTDCELEATLGHIRTGWKPHWRNTPSAEQFQTLMKDSVPAPQSLQLQILAGYLKRWERAGKPLRADPPSGLVSSTNQMAA